jgi:hypothetical protein
MPEAGRVPEAFMRAVFGPAVFAQALCAQVAFGPAPSIVEAPVAVPMCAVAWAPPQ